MLISCDETIRPRRGQSWVLQKSLAVNILHQIATETCNLDSLYAYRCITVRYVVQNLLNIYFCLLIAVKNDLFLIYFSSLFHYPHFEHKDDEYEPQRPFQILPDLVAQWHFFLFLLLHSFSCTCFSFLFSHNLFYGRNNRWFIRLRRISCWQQAPLLLLQCFFIVNLSL